MLRGLKKAVRHLVRAAGYDIVPASQSAYPPDLEPEFLAIYERCRPYTETSIERLHSLYTLAAYIVRHNIPGDVVECGVHRGGAMMCLALSLLEHHSTSRKLYLYDTFAGMTEPEPVDVDYLGEPAWKTWKEMERPGFNEWMYASLEEVRRHLLATGYPESQIVFVKGRVEETLPATAPDCISLLRLDSDWYASTRHELIHLYPRLISGGALFIDDYGHFRGARKAVDEYFSENRERVLLVRVDYTGRLLVKP